MARKTDVPHSVVFYSYPKLLFAWPIIVLGFLFYFSPSPHEQVVFPNTQQLQAQAAPPTDAQPDAESSAQAEPADTTLEVKEYEPALEVLGWVYIIAVVLVVLTLGVDIERNYAVFWVFVVLAVIFGLSWLADAYDIPVLGSVYSTFSGMDIQYDKHLGLALSIFLIVPYLLMLLWARLNDKWRITHNEFEHYSFGRADDSLARGAKRVRSTYPDLFELLLGLSGTLIVYSASGRSELRRIPHVPLLPLRRRQINRILEFTAVHTSTDEMAAIAAEDAEDDDISSDSEVGEREERL